MSRLVKAHGASLKGQHYNKLKYILGITLYYVSVSEQRVPECKITEARITERQITIQQITERENY
jgi:hypothetical protein